MKTITSNPSQSLVFVAFFAISPSRKPGQYKKIERAHPPQNLGRVDALSYCGVTELAGSGLFAVDDAGFHYEGNFFEHRDVLERTAGDCDDVCLIAGLERADFILPTQQFCAVQRAGLNRGERRHSIFHHQDKFAGWRAVRKRTDVRAHGDRDASGELALELPDVHVEHGALARGN